MRCGRCRADIMLGSAQCWNCGASVLETETGATPSPAPPPRPQQPPPVKVDRRPNRAGRRTRRKGSPGIVAWGCGLPFLAMVIAPFAVAGVAIFRAVSDSVDAAREPFTTFAGPLAVGDEVEGDLDERETDRWSLTGAVGSVQIAVDGDGDMDPVVTVLDDDGVQLGRNDDADASVSRGSRLVVTLAAGQTVDILVEEFVDRGGDYELSVTPPTDGGALTVLRPVAGEVALGERVQYSLVGENREVTIAVAGEDGFDSELYVFDAAGVQVRQVDDANGLDPEVRILVPGGERYRVEVGGVNDTRAGSYIIEVR